MLVIQQLPTPPWFRCGPSEEGREIRKGGSKRAGDKADREAGATNPCHHGNLRKGFDAGQNLGK